MIEIIPYQARWPEEFEQTKNLLDTAIGKQVLSIDHIGSTSVPLLPAKDIIDIQVTVDNLDLPLEESLSPLGFEITKHTTDHTPPGMTLKPHDLEKRLYIKNKRRVHLHIRKKETFNQKYPLIFRDYLRENKVARDAYAEIKKQLANYFPENVEAYYDIKEPVCDLIIANALEWSNANKPLN